MRPYERFVVLVKASGPFPMRRDCRQKRHEHHQQPDAVEGNGETGETQHHAEVDGNTREVVGPCVDDGRGGHVGRHVRAGPSDGGDRSSEQRKCQDKHRAAEPACRHRRRHERQGHEPVEREPALTASAHTSGGRMMT